MSLTTNSEVGLKESEFYSLHRFDNHSAWLDREIRNKRRVRGEPAGHGYAIPRAPAPPKPERPFLVQEYGMTSGLLLTRRYDQLETSFKLEATRTDPYHYPNHMRVEEDQHFEDRRARSQHIDPTRRKELPRDKVLKEAVPEEMVQNTLMANYKDMKVKVDPDILSILIDKSVRPEPATQRELNVDLSCVDLPARDKRFEENSRLQMKTVTANKGKDWSWCLGGRKPLALPDHGCAELQKSSSLPGTLGGRSLLAHQPGAIPGAFYGTTHTAKEANSRMRGGRNAAMGVAGTFPDRELRPGMQ